MKKINEMTAREQDRLFRKLIRDDLKKAKEHGWPIARYNAELNLAYREYPNGTLKCDIADVEAEFTPDKDKGGFAVSFPSLPGCLSFGDTLEAAVANGRDALLAWLAAASEDGIAIPDPLIESRNGDGSIEELFDDWDGYKGDHDTDWEDMESAGNEKLNGFAYRGYIGSVEWSDDDKCYFGKVMNSDNLIMYDGDTLAELEENFRDLIDDEILLAMVKERVEHNDPSKNISQEEFDKMFGINPEDYENLDDIEIETETKK